MSVFFTRPEYFRIYPGEDRILPLRIMNSDGTPFSLSGATEIEARFKKADGGVLSKKFTIASGITITQAALGKFKVNLTAAETATLLVGERQNFSVTVTFGSSTRKVNYRNSLTVERQSV